MFISRRIFPILAVLSVLCLAWAQAAPRPVANAAADTFAPIPVINTPESGSNVVLPNFNSITGSASDNVGITQVFVKFFRSRNYVNTFGNGSSFGTAQVLLPANLASPGAMSTSWIFPITPQLKAALDYGPYSFAVYAIDAAGNNRGAIGRSFMLVYDVDAPQPTVNTPSFNSTLKIAEFNRIIGSVSDNVGVAEVTIKIFRTRGGFTSFWNGSSFDGTPVLFQTVVETPGAAITQWSFPVTPQLKAALDAGMYSIVAYGKDAAGNSGRPFVRDFTLVSDSTAPTITLSSPTQNQSLPLTSFNVITGSVSDNIGATQALVKLFRVRGGATTFWNGTSFTPNQALLPATVASPGATSTTWSFEVSPTLKAALDNGAYLLAVYGKDAAGNQSPATGRNFTLTAPTVPTTPSSASF